MDPNRYLRTCNIPRYHTPLVVHHWGKRGTPTKTVLFVSEIEVFACAASCTLLPHGKLARVSCKLALWFSAKLLAGAREDDVPAMSSRIHHNLDEGGRA